MMRRGFVTVFSCVCAVVAQQGEAASVHAVGRYDDDSDLDLVVCHQSDDVVGVYATTSPKRVVLIEQVSVPGPVGAAIADLDGDRLGDLIVLAEGGLEVHVFVQTDDGPELANVIGLPYPADGLFVYSLCDDGTEQVFLGMSDSQNCSVILDPLGDDTADVLTDEWEHECILGQYCDDKYETSDEGECSRTPLDPGIQACIDAAFCRASDCHWACCVLKQSGEWGWVRWVAGNLACGAVADAEIVMCLPQPLLPR